MSPVIWFIPEEDFKYIATEQLSDRYRGIQLLSLHHHCPLSFLAALWMMCCCLSSPARSLFRICFRALLVWGLNTTQSVTSPEELLQALNVCAALEVSKKSCSLVTSSMLYLKSFTGISAKLPQGLYVFKYLCHFLTLNSVHLQKTPLSHILKQNNLWVCRSNYR